MPDTGVVVIGRNEGQRLVACLESLRHLGLPTVYVDSGSTDSSVDVARSYGCHTVALDPRRPFSAARARNAGLAALHETYCDLAFIQFIDGDCLIDNGWIDSARQYLTEHPEVAVVCGRRRERYPGNSLYNRLCDLEWDTSPGEASACGGDSLARVEALTRVGGFDEKFIAGEEPELCFRLRREGWRIQRLDAEMTLHNADMHRFGQWWQRAKRAGHAYAQSAFVHGLSQSATSTDGFRVRALLSIVVYAGLLPLTAILLTSAIGPLGFLLIAVYPLLWAKIQMRRPRHRSRQDQAMYGLFTVGGKFPQLLGVAEFFINHFRHGRSLLIEYK